MVWVAEEVGWSRLSVLPEQGVGTGTMWSLPVPLEGTVTWHRAPTCYYRETLEQSTKESPLYSGTVPLWDGNTTGDKWSIKKIKIK